MMEGSGAGSVLVCLTDPDAVPGGLKRIRIRSTASVSAKLESTEQAEKLVQYRYSLPQ
jgi:hypothetical protein